ncbi:MAG: DEAD/DEAH box helicase, partial [Myxococcota bacterium]
MSTVFSALPEALQQTLEAQGIVRPTPIQSQAIPKALEGHDLCAQSQTGSGKTLAFTLPLALRLKSTEAKTFPRALVLTPTRELAQQIEMVFRTYLMPLQMRCLTIIGGNAYGKQKSALRDGVDVVIGTPGRIEDLLKRGHLHLDHVEIFVLDEVDQMLDVGFAESLDNIHRGLPDQHQTLLFSATLAPQTRKMAKLLLQDPVEIKISSSVRSPQQIEHFFVPVYKSKACSALMNLLLYHNPTQAIVFCETRQECREVTVALQQRGFQASALNSDLTQELRNETLQRFRNAELQYLIATNVAA